MRGYKFSENEEIAHIHNLTNKMTVIKLLWRTREVFEGTDENVKKVKKRKFDGCLCQWWSSDSQLEEQKFHAELLVPWWVAAKGSAFAENWLQQMKYEKHVIKPATKSTA